MVSLGISSSLKSIHQTDFQTVYPNTDAATPDFCWISPTQGVLVYARGSTPYPYAKVLTVASDGTITAGSEFSIDSGAQRSGLKCAYSPYHDQVCVIYQDDIYTSYDRLKSVALTISGTSISKSASDIVWAGANYNYINTYDLKYDETNHSMHACFSVSQPGYDVKVVSLSGTNFASVGTASSPAGNVGYANITMLSANKIAFQYDSGDYCTVKIATISGSSYSWGSAYNVGDYGSGDRNDICYDSKNDSIISIYRDTWLNNIQLVRSTYSGTTVTVGTSSVLSTVEYYPTIDYSKKDNRAIYHLSENSSNFSFGLATPLAGGGMGFNSKVDAGNGEYQSPIICGEKGVMFILDKYSESMKAKYITIS